MFLTPTETRTNVINLQSGSSEVDFCLKVLPSVDFFSGAQWKAHVPVTRRESVHVRASRVWLHAVRTMNIKPPTDTASIEGKLGVKRGCSAHTHTLVNVSAEWVQ